MFNTQHIADLLTELTKKELSIRYKNMVFGYLWSIASPLAYAFIYFFVFQVVLKIPQPNYALFLIAGLYPWQWISNSLGQAPTNFVSNSSLIKKTQFPRFLIPLVTVIQDSLHFLFTIPILILFAIYFNVPPSADWIWKVPLIFGAQFLFVYSLHLLIATLTLFFRDIERFVQIFVTVAFYLTPVLYSETMIPERYQNLIPLNPFATLLINWKHTFLGIDLDWGLVGFSYLWSLFFFVVAHWIYKKLSWRFAEIM
ncbi:MAG: ABC transporter permease [Proteobacteria bacterium]|nr:ABC transporter permease [Pseudomonadota bacterium]